MPFRIGEPTIVVLVHPSLFLGGKTAASFNSCFTVLLYIGSSGFLSFAIFDGMVLYFFI